jgi:hypothetical protein
MKKIQILVTSMTLGLLLAGGAEAAPVQSSLTPNQVGITAKQLMSTSFTTNVALPSGAAKPTTMGNVVAGVHLGTNTDIFAVGTKSGFSINASEFWVRYTLDASSNATLTSLPCCEYEPQTTIQPITGSLWISFNQTTQVLSAYTSQLSSFTPFAYTGTSTLQRFDNPAVFNTLYSGGTGHPEYFSLPGSNANLYYLTNPCIECNFETSLNLSFVELRKVGSRYELFTSAQGFNQVFVGEEACSICNWSQTTALNIAPVPVPGALWLFGSGLAGIATVQRRRAARA